MNYHQHLYRTRALMDEVMTAMNNLAGTGSRNLGIRDFRTIVQRRGEFQKRLRDCFYDIADLWLDIKPNEALRFEVSTFLSRYRAFRLAARTAADMPEIAPQLKESLRNYSEYLNELDRDMEVILKEFFITIPIPARPSLAGIANSLRIYVPDADDEFYERLIFDHRTPSRPLKWQKSKVAATLFAVHFGLTDSLMNRSFLFPSRGPSYHGLKISSNIATKGDDRNGIAAILGLYPYKNPKHTK